MDGISSRELLHTHSRCGVLHWILPPLPPPRVKSVHFRLCQSVAIVSRHKFRLLCILSRCLLPQQVIVL